MNLPLDISSLPGDVQKELLDHQQAKRELALARAEGLQNRLGAQLRAEGLRERRSIEGLGAPVAEIHPISYHYWGERLGYQCWHDRQFVDEYLRDVPSARVKSKGVKEIQVGYVGGGGGGGVTQRAQRNTESTEKKFRKSYGVVGAKAVGR